LRVTWSNREKVKTFIQSSVKIGGTGPQLKVYESKINFCMSRFAVKFNSDNKRFCEELGVSEFDDVVTINGKVIYWDGEGWIPTRD
jgi:hypothetical protein